MTAWLTEKRLRKEQVRSDVRSKMMVNSLLVTSEVNSKKAANKRPLYKGGAVFETYGDKRFKWDRSSKYRGAFGCARYAAIREKLKSLI